MNQNNEGIIVSGGSFNANQVSVGHNSQAIQATYTIADDLKRSGKDEVAAALRALLKALGDHGSKVTSLDEVVQAVQQIAEETKKEKPNKITLKSLLDGIRDVVKPVAEIGPVFMSLYGTIATMIGLPKL
jgi:hypothetical protein